MAVPSVITDLSTTAASNSPAGSESVSTNVDDYFRAAFAFIAQNYANKQVSNAALTEISGLSPSNDDILQRKAGSWANRTIAQLKVDLAYGTAASLNVGTSANNVVQLDASAKLPAVDGSALTNVPGAITAKTAIATTSGTAHEFTSIPSWVKKIKVMFSGISTNGTSIPILQIGDSGGYEATGYLGAVTTAGTSPGTSLVSTGAHLMNTFAYGYSIHGWVEFANLTGNVWAFVGGSATDSGGSVDVSTVSGSKTLSGVLDRIQLTTVNGTDAFDAGSINIMYE